MKKLVLFLFCCALPWTSAQAQEISFVGGSWSGDFYLKLLALLGHEYIVDYYSGSITHYLYVASPPQVDPHSKFLVADFSPRDWRAWRKDLDSFVPDGKDEIAESGTNPKNIYLLVPRVDAQSPPALSTQYIPLLKQIARESGANVIDLNDPSFHTADAQADALHELYVSFAKVQRSPGTWRLVRATSEQSDEGPANNAIDNNPDTYWHTRYDPNPTKVPHEIVIDLGQEETLAGFSYLARQDGGVNGRVKDFEVYLSDDPDHWAAPALKGTLQNSMNEQRLLFDHPATGRYLRFRALSEVNGNIWTSVAELGIMRSGNSK